MRILGLAFTAFFILSSCSEKATQKEVGSNSAPVGLEEQQKEPVKNEVLERTSYPKFSVDAPTHDFGEIGKTEVVTHDFVFTNTGEEPLIISNAKGSCGCTVPKWPRKPVAPGDKETIQVTFNPTGKSGSQRKTVTLTTNTVDGQEQLIITAQIKAE